MSRAVLRMSLLAAATLAGAPLLHAPAAWAQSRQETLADLRRELDQLSSEMQKLRGELVASSARQPGLGAGSALERMDLMEQELRRLTNRTEELGFRVEQVVKDTSNRIGDIEFRVGELEGTGGGAPSPASPGPAAGSAPAAPSSGSAGSTPPQARPGVSSASSSAAAASGQNAEFDRARGVLGQGDFRTAENLFQTFAQTHPNDPLTGEAHYWRGAALEGQGDMLNAAKAYLESYSGWPGGAMAPEALVRLGRAVGRIGSPAEGCTALAQVAINYPESPAVAEAQAEMQSLGCP